MTTEVLLRAGTEQWDDVATSVRAVVADLIERRVAGFTVSVPDGGQHVDGALLGDGQIRLAASGNDTLVGGNRLTVRDERAVIAVGFSVASSGWGNFYWDWTTPVEPDDVAGGIIRTLRDIYKVEPADIEVAAVL